MSCSHCSCQVKMPLSHPVQSRLVAYTLIGEGSVIWKHESVAPQGITTPKSTNTGDPRTIFFPNPYTGELMSGSDCNPLPPGIPEGKFSWFETHALFETLFHEGWTVEPSEIVVTI